MKKSLMAFAAVAVLASACTNMHPETSPQLTFANYAPVTLNVQSADVVEAYQNPNDPDDVSGQFVLAPSEAIKRYAANRFKANDAATGNFTISIQDARVHLNELRQNNKVLKWADVGTEDEYHLYMTLLVTAQPDGFNGRQNTTIKMDRTLVMPASVTLAEREMRQTQFLEKLVSDIDKRVVEAMDQTPAIRQ